MSNVKDMLDKGKIIEKLGQNFEYENIEVYKSIDSTNTELKRRAKIVANHGLTLIAEEQTAGRGRMGRHFYSPANTGIYMSILLKPLIPAEDTLLITTMTSVALCLSIEEHFHKKPVIKWVNDVYMDNKKVSGILTEAVSNAVTGEIEYLIVGIGINYSTGDFPGDIEEIATGIADETSDVDRNTFTATFLKNFWRLFENIYDKSIMEQYKERSMVIGKDIRFLEGKEWTNAHALDIDDVGGLIVRLENGEERVLSTGEISLRLR